MSNTPDLTSLTAPELARILYCSELQESDRPSDEEIRAAIHDRLAARGDDGARCADLVAQEAGDHPDRYLARMRWALVTVAETYPDLTTAA